MAYNPYDLRGRASQQQAQTRKETWEAQKPEILKQAQQIQQRKNVLDIQSRNMTSGAPAAQDIREMRLTQAQQQEAQAKQRYEDYKQSDQRKTDWDKAIRDAIMEIPAAGSSLDLELGKLPGKTVNQEEAQLEAGASFAKQNRQAIQDANTMEKDVEEVARMSAEDRRLLETYAYGRNEWFDHKAIGESVAARAELEKKYGKQKVAELAESWQRYQNAMTAQKSREQTSRESQGLGGAIGHSVGSVAANAVGALTAPLGYLQEAFGRTGRYETLDPNNLGAMPGQYASAAREQVAQNIEGDGGALGKAGAVLYQGTMGALDNLARIAMGGGTAMGSLGLAAMGSFGSTLSEASAQGATPGQAVGKAVLSAGIEVATEKVPLDELFRAGKSGFQGAKAAFKQALKQGGIEAAEEEIALLGNVLTDALVMREKSSYNQQIGELVANGMSYRDAKAQADRALWDEAVNTALTSFVSGGVMSGAQSGGQYLMQSRGNSDDYIDAAAENLRQKTEAQEQPKQITDQQIREAITELYPREQTGQERMEQLEAQMQRMIDTGEYETQEGQRRYESLAQEWNAINDQIDSDSAQRADSIREAEAPPERIQMEDTGINERFSGNPLAGRTEESVGSRSVKAYQYENPEVKPYFQEAARGILADINNSLPGQKTFDEDLHYRTGGEKGWSGNKRVTTDDLAEIKDTYGYTWDELREAAEDIIHDRGQENNAASKRLEFLIHDRLANGYTDVEGRPMPANREYLDFLEERQVNEYSKEAFDALMVNAEKYAPQGAEAGGFGDNAGDAMYKSVGAAGQKFKHEVRRSKVYDNTYKNATDPEVRTAGEKALELDPKIAEYDYISEEESVSNARDRVNAPDGLEAELEYLTSKQGWTGEDNDTAMLILKRLQKDGDVAAFKTLARAQREQGTSGGQFIQSFAKYSRDATRAAVDAVEMLDKLGKGDVPKKFWKKNGSFDAWKDDILKSTMEIANDIEGVADGDADAMRNIVRQLANFRKTTAFFGMSSDLTKNAERILRKMDFGTAKDIACAQIAKIPDDFRSRSKGEVIKTIRYQNMLSSLVTVGRNLVGNGTMGMVDAFSDATAGRFADLLLSKATGKRTVGNDIRYAKEYLSAARDAADMASLLAELDIPAEHEGKYTGRTRTFSPQGGTLSRFLSAYEKYMNYALQVSDEFFSGGTAGAVSKSLEALGAKSGLTEEEIAALGNRAGRRRTFKEGRKLARASGKMKDALNVLGTENFGAGDVVLAFAETPAEMGQVAIDYSGTGILEGFAEMASIIKDARNGKAIDVERQRKAVSDFGRGVTGVGMIALFTALAAKGLIAVHDDEDKDKRGLEQSLGLSGAQFNIDATLRAMQGENTEWQDGDLVMSIDFLQPFNSQMYIGYLLSQEEEAGLKEYAGASVQGIAQSVLDIPMMGTIEDIADLLSSFGEVSEGDYSAVTDAAGQLLGNQASSFVPAWMRQTAQYMDPVYRDTTGENTLDAAKNRVMSGIPVLSQKLPAKYDGLGNLQTRYDNKLLGFFNTFLNPGALKRIQTSDIADKLEQLGDKSVYPEYLAPKSFQVDGETVMVSSKEMTETYQKTYGDNVAALYGGLMDSPDFQNLPKEAQIEALKTAKSYAAKFAKAAVSDYDDTPKGATFELVQDILQDQAGSGLRDALDSITKAINDGTGLSQEAVSGFTEAVRAYDRMSPNVKTAVAENAGGALKRYIEAKEKGVGAADFLNLYEASVKTGSYRNFDLVTEGKMDVSAANDIVWMLEGITGTGKINSETGEHNIRDIDRIQAISDGKGITDKETELAIRLLILDDKQEEKLDNVMSLGYNIDQYADFYQVQVDNGKKADFIAAIEAMGLSKAAATELYYAFNPKK